MLIKILLQINFALTDISWSMRDTCSSPSSATSYNLMIISESKCFETDLESTGRLIKPICSPKTMIKILAFVILKGNVGTKASSCNAQTYYSKKKVTSGI